MKISALFVGLLLMIQERVVFAEDTTFIEPVAVNQYANDIVVNPQIQIETDKYFAEFDTLSEVKQVDNLRVLVNNYAVPELINVIEDFNKIMKVVKEDFKEIPIGEVGKKLGPYDFRGGVKKVWNNLKDLVEPVLGELGVHDKLMPYLEEKLEDDKKITKEEAQIFLQSIRSLSSAIKNTMEKMTFDNAYVIKVAIKESEEKSIKLSDELKTAKEKLKTLQESKTADEATINKQKKKIEDLEADKITSENKYTDIFSLYSTLQTEHNKKLEEIKTLKSKAGTDEKNKLEQEKEALTTQHQKDLETIADYVKKLQIAEEGKKKAEAEKEKAEYEKSVLEKRLIDEKAKVGTGSQISKNDKTKIDTLVTALESEKAEKDKVISKLNEAISKFDKVFKENIDLKGVISKKDTELEKKNTELEECQEINKNCQIVADAFDAFSTIGPGVATVLVVAFLSVCAMWGCFRGGKQAQAILLKGQEREIRASRLATRHYAELGATGDYLTKEQITQEFPGKYVVTEDAYKSATELAGEVAWNTGLPDYLAPKKYQYALDKRVKEVEKAEKKANKK